MVLDHLGRFAARLSVRVDIPLAIRIRPSASKMQNAEAQTWRRTAETHELRNGDGKHQETSECRRRIADCGMQKEKGVLRGGSPPQLLRADGALLAEGRIAEDHVVLAVLPGEGVLGGDGETVGRVPRRGVLFGPGPRPGEGTGPTSSPPIRKPTKFSPRWGFCALPGNGYAE